MTDPLRVWVDFNARQDGYCYVPTRRLPRPVSVGETIGVYDPEETDVHGIALVVGHDLLSHRVLLEVDLASFASGEPGEAADGAAATVTPLITRRRTTAVMAVAASAAIVIGGFTVTQVRPGQPVQTFDQTSAIGTVS